MAKRILTKEKIDKQLTGQTSLTQFLSIKEGFGEKVIFNMTDSIEQKMDKLMVMMCKLVMEDKGQNRQFKPQVYQSNRDRGQTRCNYNQRRFQDRFRPNNAYRGRPSYGQDYRGRSRYDSNYRGSYRYNTRGNQRYGRPNNNNNRRGNFRNQNYDINGNRSYERQNRDRRDGRTISNSRSRSSSRVTTNRDEIRCFECRKYDHFARDCPTRQASSEAEQIQQMFNMDEDQTILQTPLMNVDQDEQTISQVETRNNLNL